MVSTLSPKLCGLIFLMLVGCASDQPAQVLTRTESNAHAQIMVKFSPGGGCTDQIVHSLNHAQKRIWVEAYSFTSYPIGQALIKAKERGVDVEIVLDHTNLTNPDSMMYLMLEHGIPVYLDHAHKIFHNKVMVVDSEYVNTGSFNFTKSAENSNAENCLLIKSTEINWQYSEEWKKHKEHSKEQ